MTLRHTAGELADTLLSTVRTRIELFSLEAADQKARLLRLLALLCATLFFLAMAVLVLSLTVALYFWPTPHRFLALWLLVLLYLILGAVFFCVLRHSMRASPAPFSGTLEELRRDMTLVGRLRDDRPARDGVDTENLP